MYYYKFQTNFCDILLVGDENGLTNLELLTGEGKRKYKLDTDFIENKDFFINTKKQILEYLDGKRKNFDIKINPNGTDYQKKVWKELQNIAYGKIYSYKDIAEKIGNPKASRAIGMANSKNPIPLIIPCHRVIGKNGKLTGFAHGLEIKKKLLELEQQKN